MAPPLSLEARPAPAANIKWSRAHPLRQFAGQKLIVAEYTRPPRAGEARNTKIASGWTRIRFEAQCYSNARSRDHTAITST
jgi:hypothetical protein